MRNLSWTSRYFLSEDWLDAYNLWRVITSQVYVRTSARSLWL